MIDKISNQEIGPTFLIVGAMKSGTGTLHAMLAQHPDIFVTAKKELHYWDTRQRGSLEGYLARFKAGQHSVARGESTPSYAFQPATAKLLAEFRPDLRLIFIMRDPVKRAISHLDHAARRSGNPRALDAMAELRAEIGELPVRERRGFVRLRRTYLARGHYHQQIFRLKQYFPDEQLLLMRLEDLTADPDGEMQRVCKFIGVEPRHLPLLHENQGRRNVLEISEEVMQFLAQYYRFHNELLRDEFGVRIDDWIKPWP
jgi:hypothetical protein